MKITNYSLMLFAIALSISTAANAAGSMLRIRCDGDDIGAEVQINGKFKGECPVDINIAEGKYQLRVVKAVDDAHERVFEQEVRVADGTVKKVDAVLSAPQLSAAWLKLEEQRLAEAQRVRAKFERDIASGAIRRNFRDCPDCPEMVAIPPGSFDMGSDNGDADEKPVHSVTIARAFALGKTEVTQAQWRAVMGNNPSNFKSCGDNCPVERVSRNDVQEFIRKLNSSTGKQYRLPSEAEWEYACRAGGRHEYCGSDNSDSVAWNKSNSGGTSHPVGLKQANAFGLYDMSGNVWEWVEDREHNSYNGAPSDGSAWQGDSSRGMLRGSSWFNEPLRARAADRFNFWFDSRDDVVGFRLARTLP